jgi:hypothetical protein
VGEWIMDLYVWDIPVFWIVFVGILIPLFGSLAVGAFYFRHFGTNRSICPYFHPKKPTDSCKVMQNKYCSELNCKHFHGTEL